MNSSTNPAWGPGGRLKKRPLIIVWIGSTLAWPEEIWIGDPNYGTTLQAAVAAIGSSQVILRAPAGNHNFAADFSIPANITLKPERGALLIVADGKTLTLNGGVEAGLYQIFSCTGSGKVVFAAGAGSHRLSAMVGGVAGSQRQRLTPLLYRPALTP